MNETLIWILNNTRNIAVLCLLAIIIFAMAYILVRLIAFGIFKSFFEARRSYYEKLVKKLQKGDKPCSKDDQEKK